MRQGPIGSLESDIWPSAAGTRAFTGSEARPKRAFSAHWALSLALFGGAAFVVAVVLGAGQHLSAAPKFPAKAFISGPASEACLGSNVGVVQSGMYVQLETLTAQSGSAAPGSAGLMKGRASHATRVATLKGHCANGTLLAGAAAMAHLVVANDRSASVTVDVNQESFAAELTPAPKSLKVASGPFRNSLPLAFRTLLVMAVVVGFARLLGSAFNRIRQPRVMGELVAGIALGPSLLGIIWPGSTSVLFPADVRNILGMLGRDGLVLFMFFVGLELDIALVRKSGRTALAVSNASIALPFAIGASLALVVYPILGGGSFTALSLFMGSAMSITAFPVLARILGEARLSQSRLGSMALTCAAANDVAAWLMLAVVVAVVGSHGLVQVLFRVAETAAFFGAMWFLVRPLLARISPDASDVLPKRMLATALILGGVFLSATVTTRIGIHAIFGAFIFGVVTPRSLWAGNVGSVVRAISSAWLLPLYFLTVGMSAQIGALQGWTIWALVGMIILGAFLGKFGGATLAARFTGQSWRSAGALGVLMNTRGITEIVILTVGVSLGVVSPMLFMILLLMGLVTTLMTMPMLALVYPSSLREIDPIK